MAGPLSGVRILDLSTMISGPFATMMLGDQGADVIKIERPGTGDQMRLFGQRRGALTAPFINNNRSKRSVAVDLKTVEGCNVVKRLAKTADVVVQNFRPGVVDKLGLGEPQIRAIKPDIIFVSLSGFGDKGLLSNKPAYDPIIQAVSGLTSIQGGSDDERPCMIRAMLPDKIAAYTAAQAIISALYARTLNRKGQHIRLSMLDAVLSFLWSGEMDGHTFIGDEVQGPEGLSPFDLIYETSDGHICVATVTDAQWKSFAHAVGHAEWLSDPRFSDSAAREQHRNDRLALMQEVLKTGTTQEWVERLEQADVPCSKTYTRREVVRHPHVVENESLETYEHRDSGALRQARHAPRFDVTPVSTERGPPLLGEHTDEVLDEAGYTDEEVAALRRAGIIA
ncbi:MAG: CaiB/BaiF CoA transferase family protein [Gammaproteobacteria bacterium]